MENICDTEITTWATLIDAIENIGIIFLCPFVISGDDCPGADEIGYRVKDNDQIQLLCEPSNTGDSLCTIDCPGIHFEILPFGTLILDGITLRGSQNTAIRIKSYGALEALNSAFEDNVNNSGNGGAINAEKNSRMAIEYTRFQKNEGISGGAIYLRGSAFMKGSIFLDNKASGGGGSIYVGPSAKTSLTENLFSGNKALIYGPAVFDAEGGIIILGENSGCGNNNGGSFPIDCNGVSSLPRGGMGEQCATFALDCIVPTPLPSTTSFPSSSPSRSSKPSFHPSESPSSLPSLSSTKPSIHPSESPSSLPSSSSTKPSIRLSEYPSSSTAPSVHFFDLNAPGLMTLSPSIVCFPQSSLPSRRPSQYPISALSGKKKLSSTTPPSYQSLNLSRSPETLIGYTDIDLEEEGDFLLPTTTDNADDTTNFNGDIQDTNKNEQGDDYNNNFVEDDPNNFEEDAGTTDDIDDDHFNERDYPLNDDQLIDTNNDFANADEENDKDMNEEESSRFDGGFQTDSAISDSKHDEKMETNTMTHNMANDNDDSISNGYKSDRCFETQYFDVGRIWGQKYYNDHMVEWVLNNPQKVLDERWVQTGAWFSDDKPTSYARFKRKISCNN